MESNTIKVKEQIQNHLEKKKNIRRSLTSSLEINLAEAPQEETRDSYHFTSTFVAGVGSGALSSIICAPLDLIRTRMQVWGDISLKTPATPSSVFHEILQKEGYQGLFRG